MTEAECDGCWGSGDASKPGENLRAKEAAEREAYRVRYRGDAAAQVTTEASRPGAGRRG